MGQWRLLFMRYNYELGAMPKRQRKGRMTRKCLREKEIGILAIRRKDMDEAYENDCLLMDLKDKKINNSLSSIIDGWVGICILPKTHMNKIRKGMTA